jgi:hypothetical protein
MDLNSGLLLQPGTVTVLPVTDLVIKTVHALAEAQGFKSLKFKNRHGVILHDADWTAGVDYEGDDDDVEDDDEEEDDGNVADGDDGYQDEEEQDEDDEVDQTELDETLADDIVANPTQPPLMCKTKRMKHQSTATMVRANRQYNYDGLDK